MWAFLQSNLSLVLILLATVVGLAALLITPREEDPQIVVPMADVLVRFPGHSAQEVERLVTTPLEKLLHEIDGVEHVYSMSRQDQAIITVRFFVGEDRERSLVKLYKRIDEHVEIVPAGVAGWVVKPVEIDDVPVVTLTLRAASDEGGDAADQAPLMDDFGLRRVAEELTARLAGVKDLSRAYVIGACQGYCMCTWMRTACRHATFHPWKSNRRCRLPTSNSPLACMPGWISSFRCRLAMCFGMLRKCAIWWWRWLRTARCI
ncbi:MAG: efflux RND transporter permease subunit [Phycisphaerales bacterium]|nr:efflux RND transporter permease subunit [Phycisphaerales bacterium]